MGLFFVLLATAHGLVPAAGLTSPALSLTSRAPPLTSSASPARAYVAQLQPAACRAATVRMDEGSRLSPTVGYAYVGLLAASVFAAAAATSTGSPPNGLLIVTVAFTLATGIANLLVKEE